MTLNLSGAATDNLSPLINLSPSTSPKTPTTPSGVLNGGPSNVAALITFNTPPASPVFGVSSSSSLSPDTDADSAAAPLNNSNVTVTHFSEQRGGVVEKISVPALNIYSHEMSSPKLDNTTRAQQSTIKSNNPFINSPASPVLSNGATASTNPFLRNLTEADAENNNNHNNSSHNRSSGSHHVANGRNKSVVVGEEDSEEDNLDVKEEKEGDKMKIVDKNPFRDGETKATNVTAMAEDRNGNQVAKEEEAPIVTVSEIDGKRVAEIIKVSDFDRSLMISKDEL